MKVSIWTGTDVEYDSVKLMLDTICSVLKTINYPDIVAVNETAKKKEKGWYMIVGNAAAVEAYQLVLQAVEEHKAGK